MRTTLKITLRQTSFFFFLLASIFLIYCSGKLSKDDRTNVLLITIDTLRADHLSCYGYHKKTSTYIDQLSKNGVLFENAFCQIPNTNASHSSIMTAKYPRGHGVLRLIDVLKLENKTLAEILKENEYTTGAFVSAFALDSRFGLNQGFDSYIEVYEKKEFTLRGMTTADRVNQEVIPWLDKNKERAFFLWVHYFDPHLPYNPPNPYDKQFSNAKGKIDEVPGFEMREKVFKGKRTLSRAEIRAFTNKYDGEISFTDYHVGFLLKELERFGLNNRTLIILTADHGENLHEHINYFGHEYSLYNPSLQVPLIFSYPDVIPTAVRRKEQVELVDIVPTVLEILKIENEKPEDGFSLVSLLSREEEIGRYREIIFAETFPLHYPYTASVQTDSWKYIEIPEQNHRELYDLKHDPLERDNLIAEKRDIAEKLGASLERWRSGKEEQKTENLKDDETIKRLKSLGYL